MSRGGPSFKKRKPLIYPSGQFNGNRKFEGVEALESGLSSVWREGSRQVTGRISRWRRESSRWDFADRALDRLRGRLYEELVILAILAALASLFWVAAHIVLLFVPGMNCATCHTTTRKASNCVSTLSTIEINLGGRAVKANFDGTDTSSEALARVAKDVGYVSILAEEIL